MIFLNLHNVEELIFYDHRVKKLLPEYANTFAQWTFAKQNIGMRQLAKRTLSDFLESLQEEHLSILAQYFGDKITINKMDYHIIKNVDFDPEEAELLMNGFDEYDLAPFINKEGLHITFWR